MRLDSGARHWATFLGLSLAIGCSGRHTQLPAPAPVVKTAVGLVPGPDGRRFAIVRPVSYQGECSNMGGDHWALEIDEPDRPIPRFAHAGGHGVQLQLAPIPEYGSTAPLPAKYYVAELQMVAPPSREGLDPWCIVGMPAFDASTYRMIAAPDLEAARRLLATIAERGMPPLSAELAAPDGAEDIAVARIRSVGPAWMSFGLESVDGSAPASLDLSSTRSLQPAFGDYLVVASMGRGEQRRATRVLAADDRAAAMRWAAWVRREGWPPAVLHASREPNLATMRWTLEGKIVEGRPGCGPSIEGNWGDGVTTDTWSAAAPAGVQLGQTVTAITVARFEDDACGHDLRAVRVYANPGTLGLDPLYGGILTDGASAAPTPIVE